MQLDEELERRRLIDDYDLKKQIDRNRRESERRENESQLELQRYMWKRQNYTTGIHQEDTNYPIDDAVPYPFGDGKKISSLTDPFDEKRWGKESVYYWMNRNGQNNVPMVWMVEPPF